MPTIGVEIEMPVIDAESGMLHSVQQYFHFLAQAKQLRGQAVDFEHINGRTVAVKSGPVISSLDNAFNNLESSIGPIGDADHNLDQLDRQIQQELSDVCRSLETENAAIINFSEHPSTQVDQAFYLRNRSPKPIYDYWVGYRGWNHMAGLDAKAHNGPTTGVGIHDAVRGLNAMLGLSAVFIGLYANSPFEAGRLTGFKENRQTLWPRMFESSRFPADRRLHGVPDKPFKDLRHYFQWMFGPGTAMQIVFGQAGGDYKKPIDMVLAQGDPPALDFLREERWQVRSLDGSKVATIEPTMQHLEFLQFSNFLDTRIRYGLNGVSFRVEEFLAALEGAMSMEELFELKTSYVYLEGRAAGANFPDAELAGLDDGDIPRSVVISPSALQLGILSDLDSAMAIVDEQGWERMCALRHAAVRHGLAAEYEGVRLRDICARVVEIAGRALPSDMAWTLAYPIHVLATGKTGADRALESFEKMNGEPGDRLRRLILQRRLLYT